MKRGNGEREGQARVVRKVRVERKTNLGADFGIEVVLFEGAEEVVDGEGDALHGGGAAAVVGLLELLLELHLLPRLQRVGVQVHRLRHHERPAGKGAAPLHGLRQWGRRQRGAPQPSKLLPQRRRHFLPLPPLALLLLPRLLLRELRESGRKKG